MTTILSAVDAALKTLYPGGMYAMNVQDDLVTRKRTKEEKDFKGRDFHIPILHEWGQGVGATVADAQGSVSDNQYKRFVLPRVKYYAIARVDGETIEAAKPPEGSVPDIWKQTIQGAQNTAAKLQATHQMGAGDGVIGQTLSGTATTTIQLTSDTNMNYFALNKRIQFVSATGLNPTVRTPTGLITSIDRVNRTIGFAAALTGLTDGDYIVDYGYFAGVSTYKALMGFQGYVVGGSNPSTLFELVRNVDPNRLAGLSRDVSAQDPFDAISDMAADLSFQGCGAPDTAVVHPVDMATMARSLRAKDFLDRSSSSEGKAGYDKISIKTLYGGMLELKSDPLAPLSKCLLLNLKGQDKVSKPAFVMKTLGGAMHVSPMADKFVYQLPTDDVFESRWVGYLNQACYNPAPNAILTNFCVG